MALRGIRMLVTEVMVLVGGEVEASELSLMLESQEKQWPQPSAYST